MEELIPTNYSSEETLFKCSDCGKTFTSKSGLSLHMRMHSNKTSNEEKIFNCEICDRKFQFKLGLTNHMRMHYNENAKNLQKSLLAIHDNTSEDEIETKKDSSVIKSFPCIELGCDRTFKTRGNLGNHMRYHSNKNAKNIDEVSKEKINKSLEKNKKQTNGTGKALKSSKQPKSKRKRDSSKESSVEYAPKLKR